MERYHQCKPCRAKKSIIFLLAYNLIAFWSIAQFRQPFFVIGTYADPRISRDNNAQADSVSFSRAKNAYFNLLSGPQYYNGSQDYTLMDKTLELASKFNLYLLVIDSKLNILKESFSKNTADSIINHFNQLPEYKKKYVLGYYFGGEFNSANASKVKKWTQYFKTNSSGKLAYHYLLPDYGFKTQPEYKSYLDAMLSDNDKSLLPDVISYDYYPFIQSANGVYMRDSYFENLRLISETSRQNNKPFWFYILTAKHFQYSDPDEYQLRFMAFSPIAYGAKGMLYYTYETIPERFGLKYGDAIIDKNGNPTYKYNIVKNINHYVQDVLGPVVMNNTYISTFNYLQSNSKDVSINAEKKADDIISNNNDSNLVIGVFKSPQQSKSYFLILVNKNKSAVADLHIKLNGIFKNALLYPAESEYNGSVNLKSIGLKNNRNSSEFVIDDLKPADAVVIKIGS